MISIIINEKWNLPALKCLLDLCIILNAQNNLIVKIRDEAVNKIQSSIIILYDNSSIDKI